MKRPLITTSFIGLLALPFFVFSNCYVSHVLTVNSKNQQPFYITGISGSMYEPACTAKTDSERKKAVTTTYCSVCASYVGQAGYVNLKIAQDKNPLSSCQIKFGLDTGAKPIFTPTDCPDLDVQPLSSTRSGSQMIYNSTVLTPPNRTPS